ncbi:nuclease-related domain-containing protein [Streptomyces sp. NPDC056500]|uniref:nuclease-related domain-containing protein n=1 Tax=Streptomyces sp. NPDC056500 TaxID=3345840 RepID=UPI0036B19746
MDNLEVNSWKRYGHDRLYVRVVGGENVAWFDRKSGRLTMLDESYRDQVLDVLAPYLLRPESPRSVPLPAGVIDTPSPPDSKDDLALNRPGELLFRHLEGSRPWFVRFVMRLWGKEDEKDRWRKGIAGERIVGAELARLKRRGWSVLHSIPLPNGGDIDHLLIGPGGVFCLNTKNFPNARVWVGDDVVKVNGGPGRPYVRKSRHESNRASMALTRACGFSVAVRPLLVFVSPAKLQVAPSLHGVQAIKHRELSSFRKNGVLLKPDEIASIYAVARNPRTWQAI